MKDTVKRFIYIGLWIAIGLFVIRYVLCKPTYLHEIVGAIGEVISVTLILMGAYEKWLWRWNPLERTPFIKGNYTGAIEHGYNGKTEKKKVSVSVRQSLLSIYVKITTNEITSSTITSSLVRENGEYVLYYTYITNPKSKFSKENPIQYGTCRLNIINKNELRGVYWTSQQTKGDIIFKRSDK